MSRLIVRDLIAYLPARVIPAVVALAAIPVLTRLLPPEEYGNYLLALTALMLVGSLCASWLVSLLARFHALYPADALARACRPLVIASMLAGAGLWLAIGPLLGSPLDGAPFAVAGVLWIVGYAAFEYGAGWLRVQNRAVAYGIFQSWRSIGGTLLAIAGILFFSRTGSVVIAGMAVATLLGVAWLSRRWAGEHAIGTTGDAPVPAADLLRYGIPVAASNLCVVGLSSADRFIVKAILGAEPLAVYGASYDIAERSIFFLNAMLLLSSSVMAIGIFDREGDEAAAGFLTNLIRIYLLIAFPIVVAMAALSGPIVSVLLPTAYREGSVVLPIVAVSAMLVGILHRYSLTLSFHKRSDLVLLCTAVALGANIVSCLFLVPRLGLLGAAIGTLIGYGSWLLAIRISAGRYAAARFPWRSFLRIAAAGGGAAIVMRWLGTPSVLGVASAAIAGGLTFGALLILVGEISRAELKAAAGMVRRRRLG